MSKTQIAEKQSWRSIDGDVTYNGVALMRRLIKLGTRKAVAATLDELLAVPVGGSIATGVSAYKRTV